jgi:FG-GAP-like repeat/FlgD Ig-like domain
MFVPPRRAVALAPAAILAALALSAPSAFSSTIEFEDHTDYPAGNFPLRVAVADLNGDGHADIVATNPSSSQEPFRIAVLSNLGDGTFAPAAFYPTAAPGRCVAAGDLDGDGHVDLAVGLQEGDFRVALLMNDAQGGFAAPELLALLTGRPDVIDVPDLDGDGDRDILLTQAAGEEVVVLRNEGNGTFASPGLYGGTTDAYFAHSATGDVDSDGDPDLVFSRSIAGTPPSVYRNRGDGTFDPREPLDTPLFSLAGVDLGDLDGDLDLDVVLISELGPLVFVLRNNGEGLFTPWGSFPSGVETQFGSKVRVADLDEDGFADVIVPAGNTFRVGVLRGGPSGLEAATFHQLGGQPTDVAAADLDHDGDLDLAAGLPNSDQVSVLANISGGTAAVGQPAAPVIALTFGPARSNPTPAGATIPYVLPAAAEVRIAVFDVAGRRVRDLFQGELAAGERMVTWDGRNDTGARVGAGVYWVEMNGGEWRRTARIVVAR